MMLLFVAIHTVQVVDTWILVAGVSVAVLVLGAGWLLWHRRRVGSRSQRESSRAGRLLDEHGRVVATLTMGHWRIGTATDNEIVLRRSKKANAYHAEIFCEAGAPCVLCDLRSAQGTTVNGKRGRRFVLRSGDQLVFADARLRYVVDPSK